MKTTILIILFIALSGFNLKKPDTVKAVALKPQKEEVYNYDKAVEVIKYYEVFKSRKYELFGHWYIGYGHLITEGEYFDTLTEEQATKLLKKDFDKGLSYVKKFARGASDNKKLVLACYVYNCGIGSLLKSGLIKDISRYKTTCYANGKWLKGLEQRRIDEYKLLDV